MRRARDPARLMLTTAPMTMALLLAVRALPRPAVRHDPVLQVWLLLLLQVLETHTLSPHPHHGWQVMLMVLVEGLQQLQRRRLLLLRARLRTVRAPVDRRKTR